MKLNIIDLSPCIYVGRVNKTIFIPGPMVKTPEGKWSSQADVQLGGISTMLQTLWALKDDGDVVLAADRNPFIKREMLPAYKSNRKHDVEVSKQKEIAEIIAKDCGVTVLWRDGYEADDVIFTLHEAYKGVYDEIVIHTDDSDMFFMVDEHTRTQKIKSNGKSVNMDNYATVIKKDEIVKYNTVLMNKVLKGDTSDNVLPAPPHIREVIIRIFNNDFYFPKMGNVNFMRATLKAAVPEAVQYFDIIAPLFVPDIILPENPGFNVTRVAQWATHLNIKAIGARVPVADDLKELAQSFLNL